MIIICNTDISRPPTNPKVPGPKKTNSNNAITAQNTQQNNGNATVEELHKEPNTSEWKVKINGKSKLNPNDKTKDIENKLGVTVSFDDKNTSDDKDKSKFSGGIEFDVNNIKDNKISFVLPKIKDTLQFGLDINKLEKYKVSAILNDTFGLSLNTDTSNASKAIEVSIDILELVSFTNDVLKELNLAASYDESKGIVKYLVNGLAMSITIKIGSINLKITMNITHDSKTNTLSKEFTIQIDNAISITISLNKTLDLFGKKFEFSNLLEIIDEIGCDIDVMKQLNKITSSQSKTKSCESNSERIVIFEEQQLTKGGL
jgi:hypothetical protein